MADDQDILAGLDLDGKDLGADLGFGDATPTANASGDDALAADWASSLAQDEAVTAEKQMAETSTAQQATDAKFKDMTETARQPSDNKLKRELDFILDIPLDVSA